MLPFTLFADHTADVSPDLSPKQAQTWTDHSTSYYRFKSLLKKSSSELHFLTQRRTECFQTLSRLTRLALCQSNQWVEVTQKSSTSDNVGFLLPKMSELSLTNLYLIINTPVYTQNIIIIYIIKFYWIHRNASRFAHMLVSS